MLHQQQVDVVAAEMRVAVGRRAPETRRPRRAESRCRSAAAEVVDGDDAGVALVEAVGERRRGRLVDDAQHVEPGDAAGVARRGALRVVEIGRHGDHRAIDLVVELALRGEELLGAALQLAQHEGGNLRRRELAVAEPDPDDARRLRRRRGTETAAPRRGRRRRPLPMKRLTEYTVRLRVGQQPALRLAPDVDRPVGRHRDDRRHQRRRRSRSRMTSGTPSFT